MRSQTRAALLPVMVLVNSALLACTGGADKPAAGRSAVVAPTVTDSAAPSGSTGSTGDTERRTILFLGTSLTAGLGLEPDSAFPQQIQRKIDASGFAYQVVNGGVSGETTAGLRQRLDWVLQRPAAVIVVETGANDGLRGSPVEGTKRTIREILTRIHAAQPAARVVLVQMEAPTNLGPEYTSAFHAMFPELAKETGAVLMPFLLDSVAGDASLNQADGVHPNLAGERKVTRNVWRSLEPLLAAGHP